MEKSKEQFRTIVEKYYVLDKNQGITLIALVITIIVLLILAGVTINLTLGENGIFKTAGQAAEKHTKSVLKEEIELAIVDIQTEELARGNFVTLEKLANRDLVNKLAGIEATLENNEIIGSYKEYEYVIDKNFKVTIGGKVQGINIQYTLNSNNYINGDIILTILATSTNGEITKIEAPSELMKNEDGTYTITQNGNYEFTVIDSAGTSKSKTITIQNIDKLAPLDFAPTINELKSTSFVITVDVEDEESNETNVKSGIERYEYYVNGTKYESTENNYKVTGLNKTTQYSIYVIAFDKAGNDKKSETISTTTTNGDYPTLTLDGMYCIDPASDALLGECYDNDYNSYQEVNKYVMHNGYSIKIDPECWGKYLSIYCQTPSDSYRYGYVVFETTHLKTDIKNGHGYVEDFTGASIHELQVQSILIPAGAYWVRFETGTTGDINFNVYEVWCSEENLTGTIY